MKLPFHIFSLLLFIAPLTQTKFMTMAFGGPNSYNGKSMAAAHKNLIEKQGLNETHFDMVAGHLVSTLKDLGVTQPLIDDVLAVVGPLRSVFERPATASGLVGEGEVLADK